MTIKKILIAITILLKLRITLFKTLIVLCTQARDLGK